MSSETVGQLLRVLASGDEGSSDAVVSIWIPIAIAVVGLVGAVVAAVVSARSARRREEDARRADADARMERFKGPLIQASFELQSRIYNILNQGFAERYHTGTDRQREYVIRNTQYVIAQYSCWTEIIRSEIQFLRIGDDSDSKRLADLRTKIYECWQDDRLYGQSFMIWAGEQRSIGERLIVKDGNNVDCLGYSEFLRTPDSDSEPQVIKDLTRDIKSLMDGDPTGATSRETDLGRERLRVIQNLLIELLELVDPEYLYFPKEHRTALPPDPQPPTATAPPGSE